jgi:hypothetical protein
VELNPLDEAHHPLLIRSLATAGDGIAAARQVASCRELFRRELGIEPSPALQAAASTSTARAVAPAITGPAAVCAQIEAGEAAVRAPWRCTRLWPSRSRAGSRSLPTCAASSATSNSCGASTNAQWPGWRVQAPTHARLASMLRDPDAAGLGVQRHCALRAGAGCSRFRGRMREAAGGQPPAGVRPVHDRPHAPVARRTGPGGTALDASISLSRSGWTAFLPWPQSLRAEVDLQRGNTAAAADAFDAAFALGCQRGIRRVGGPARRRDRQTGAPVPSCAVKPIQHAHPQQPPASELPAAQPARD